MNQKIIRKRLILLVGVIIFGLSVIFWQTGLLSKNFTGKLLTETQIGAGITKILNKQVKENGGAIVVNDQGKSWWMSESGYKITLEPVKTYEWQIDDCEQILTEQMTVTVESKAAEFASELETFLLKYQFARVNFATAYNREDNLYKQLVQAYEDPQGTLILLSNDYRCLVGTDGKKINSYQVSVFNKNLLNAKLVSLEPILNDLKIVSSTGVSLVAQNDNFAHLILDNGFIQVQLIAKKMDQVWQGIYSGSETIDCSLVQIYQIPEEIYRQCAGELTNLNSTAVIEASQAAEIIN